MTFGDPNKEGSRIHNLGDIETFFNVLQAHGHSEVNPIIFYNEE